ncbi:MAG: c-type cytochrome, partial [Anaerolineae bacterium]|nr:c-type cytochrome [Anaerolineae bacterium]
MIRALRWISLLATSAIVFLLVYNIGREPVRQEQAAASYHTAALANGTDLYAMHCARCHGAAGEGLGAYRALNQDFIASKPAGELHTVIAYGRYATDMAAFGLDQGGALTAAQVNDLVLMLQHASWENVAARVAALGYMPTEEDILAAQSAAQQSALALGAADADTLALGLSMFETHCTECHGPEGEGSNDAPQLKNAYVQGMSEAQLLEIVGLGVRNTEMEGFQGQLAEHEIAALIQLLRNWGNLDGAAPAGEFQIAT